MDSDNLLLTVAVIAVLVAAIGVGATFYSVASVKEVWFTGYASYNATINVTISPNTIVNFTSDNIDFGTGTVNDSSTHVNLSTVDGSMLGGNGFDSVSSPLVLENIGNTNASLSFKAQKNVSDFIGGTDAGGPLFGINVTEADTNPCADASEVATFSTWYYLNQTEQTICTQFGTIPAGDELNVDVFLLIPSDSSTGSLGNTLSAVITAA
jgi:hypothetical protein